MKIPLNNLRVAVKTDSDDKVDDRDDDGEARFCGHWVTLMQQWPQYSAPCMSSHVYRNAVPKTC